MTGVYHTEYPGVFEMVFFDNKDPLQRWFDNFKLDKDAYYSVYEIMIVRKGEVVCKGKYKPVFVGEIQTSEGRKLREVRFDLTAPAPPSYYKPAEQPKPQQPESWSPRPPSPTPWWQDPVQHTRMIHSRQFEIATRDDAFLMLRAAMYGADLSILRPQSAAVPFAAVPKAEKPRRNQ